MTFEWNERVADDLSGCWAECYWNGLELYVSLLEGEGLTYYVALYEPRNDEPSVACKVVFMESAIEVAEGIAEQWLFEKTLAVAEL